VYAWKNHPTATKLTLCGARFPSIDGKLFSFCNSVSHFPPPLADRAIPMLPRGAVNKQVLIPACYTRGGGEVYILARPPNPKTRKSYFYSSRDTLIYSCTFLSFSPVSICDALLCIDTINSPISPLFCQIPFSYFCPSNNICRYSPP
jgi:hypothetical protein